ncbi:HNH endonuclease [Flexivirga sp. ID2601S]|uniref:HNH endonuclease n=1 Tax=Flexivirga aerilata TaxID=1656889 RepID=A0A849AME5_9MICO|nr:HNH endonuclease signature motif containing protein [Flexivirga aerilata]NNG40957.1 HNH endonuclease [Flexivirga aerilata]
MTAEIEVAQRVQNTAWAAQSARVAQLAAVESVVEIGTGREREITHPIGEFQSEWLPVDLGVRLGWSDRQVQDRINDSVAAITCTPRLFAQTAEGMLDSRKLTAVTDVVSAAPEQAIAAVEDALVTQDPATLTSTKLARRARRLLTDADAVEADRAAAARRARRIDVTCEEHWEPGLSTIRAALPTQTAATVMAAVTELARQWHQDTTTDKGMHQCRADAFTDLLLSNAQVSTRLTFQVPVEADAGARPDAATTRTAVVDGPSVAEPDNAWGAPTADETRLLFDLASSSPTGVLPPGALAGGDARWGVREIAGSYPDDVPVWELDLDIPPPDDPVDFPAVLIHSPAQSRGGPPGFALCTAGRATSSTSVPSSAVPSTGARRTGPVRDVLVPGVGVIPAGVVCGLTGALGTTVSRVLVDARTGTTAETSTHAYRPHAGLARFVRTRDQHCRFPGCTRPAWLCELDHVIPWPAGSTSADNLEALCKHHHRAKHETAWRVTMTADGLCTWVSPSGRRYLTHPGD